MIKVNLYNMWFVILLTFSLFMIFCSLSFMAENYSVMLEWSFLSLNSVSVIFLVYLDWISLIFSFVVLFISSVVVLYSSIYMGYNSQSSLRFLFLVLMFVLSMFLMILSPNMISIMLGWDGLGLVSYCLVIYYSSMKSFLAGMVTCLINRLGDIGLLVSISWIFSYGGWSFIFYMDFFNELIFYIIILSSFTKSAQIPLSIWLPAAMAAPTPVSSLVHSSTLVTAGVYLLIRFYKYLMFVNNFLLYISLMTLIMSSLCASYEFDLSKVIALSTLSQLGLMMSCLFMGLMDLAFFHLLSHAMFKSLLFLCSGIMIHLMGGCQDIRFMGSICLSMPYTCCCFNISNMALCGFPFLSGFYSKDLIIETMSFQGINMLVFLLMFFSLGLTSFYSVRLFYYSILCKLGFMGFLNLGDNISLMKISIGLLSLFSLSFGCLYMWVLNLDMKFLILPFHIKILTIVMVLLGFYLGYEFSSMMYFLSMNFYHFNGSMWFMYSYSSKLFKLGYFLGKNFNYSMLWGELFGGLGLSFYLIKLSNSIQILFLSSLSVFFLTIIIWMFFMI
uniref:NADH-ubiquinone oxidoreductase chain 5 n=1 Tax=Abrus expansivus TaxID=2664682 RepID=A0A5Q0RZ41_9HEMI|nr:NADH dehydrogenase subunit 5 [Abrus expansivus]QGA47524.1 NADH dehydrogenase subunit 5 [Abrus expansivus]